MPFDYRSVEGEASSNIKLTNNDFTHVKAVTELKDGAKDSAVREANNFK